MSEEQVVSGGEMKKPSWFARHKVLTVILGVVVFFIIVGSLGDSNTSEKVSNSQDNSQSKAMTEEKKEDDSAKVYKVGESIKLGGAILTVNEAKKSTGGQYSKPQPGNEWVNLNITIENTEDSEQYLTTLGQMFLRDGEGNSYQVAVTDKVMESVNNNLDGTIIAKSKRTGWVGFEVKKDAGNLQFQYNGSMWGGGNILVDLAK